MDYKILVSPRAIKEIEQAINFYSLYDDDAPTHFIDNLSNAFRILESNPFFEVNYKNIRMIPLKKFPYSLHYIINEDFKRVRILSCFHQKRDPKKLP